MIDVTGAWKPVVLIVEDEAWLRLDAVDLVEEAGFEAIEARDADHALQLLKTRPDIGIIITDIDMPGSMDGVRLAQAVHDGWPPIKIIIVSSHLSVADEDMPAGGMFFRKPYRPADMQRALNG